MKTIKKSREIKSRMYDTGYVYHRVRITITFRADRGRVEGGDVRITSEGCGEPGIGLTGTRLSKVGMDGFAKYADSVFGGTDVAYSVDQMWAQAEHQAKTEQAVESV